MNAKPLFLEQQNSRVAASPGTRPDYPNEERSAMESISASELGLLYFIGHERREWLNSPVELLTRLGDPETLTVVVIVFSGLLALLGRFRLAGLLIVVSLTAGATEVIVRNFVNRPRPQVIWRQIPLPKSPGFPSWHALGSMAIYLSIAFLLRRQLNLRRLGIVVIGLAVLLSLLIGLSRIYLGVHFPMDVLAGWLGGATLAVFAEALGIARGIRENGKLETANSSIGPSDVE